MRTQHVHHLGGEPARVAELDRMAEVGREFGERAGEALIVALEGRRQLPQQRAELARLRERLDPIEQKLQVAAGLAQPFDVRQVAADLDCEREVRRRPVGPALGGFASRQPVERRIELDGVEAARVELEPAPCRETRRVELASAPGPVIPARAADPDLSDARGLRR
jgi:hypothetical protein